MSDPHLHHGKELFFITSAVSWCVCLIQIMGICAFSRTRHLLIIKKRYPRLIMLEAFVSVFNLAIAYPATMAYQYEDYDNNALSAKWWPYLSTALNVYTAQITTIIEACRIWLISYDLQYLHSSQNQQWKTVIDESYAERDWYLHNRGRWGNKKYVARLGFIYYMITSSIVFVTNWTQSQLGIDQMHVFGLLGLCWFVPVSIPIVLYVKTPRNLQDLFLFHFEFKWSFIVMIIGASIGAIFLIIFSIGLTTLAWTVLFIIMLYSHTLSSLSTLVIPRKVSMMIEWDAEGPTAKVKMESSSGDFRGTMQAILMSEQKCEAFVDWMYREFSSEVILSFLEFIQFRKFVKAEIRKTDGVDIDEDSDPYDFDLFDGMPQSTIVYDSFQFDQSVPFPSHLVDVPSDSIKSADLDFDGSPTQNPLIRCKRIAHLLFMKYIDYDAQHEINISGRLRDKYVEMERMEYDGMDLKQFVTVYDEVISEMMKYQSESYMRFERAHQM